LALATANVSQRLRARQGLVLQLVVFSMENRAQSMRNGEQPMGALWWFVAGLLVGIVAVAFFVPH
jgi:hypothetical protein